MKLVKDARKAWRWFSVQAMAVLAALPLVWVQIPPDVQDMLPEAWRPWVLTAIAISGIIGRLVPQESENV
jgi:hypothetical protein